MTWLKRIADDLGRASIELEDHADEDPQFRLWAAHFKADQKDMQLKALLERTSKVER